MRSVIDHARRSGGGAPGELRVDDDAQQVAVQLTDEPVDLRLVCPLRAELRELRQRERFRQDVHG